MVRDHAASMFERLNELSEEKRRGVALVSAGGVTALIVAAWLVGFMGPVSGMRGREGTIVATSEKSMEDTLSPLRTIRESFNALVGSMRGELGGVFWGIGAESEKPDEKAGSAESIVEKSEPFADESPAAGLQENLENVAQEENGNLMPLESGAWNATSTE